MSNLKQCQAITRKGRQCSIEVVEPGIDLCHVHNPAGTYQRQRRGELPIPGRAASAGGQRVDTSKDLRSPERKPRPVEKTDADRVKPSAVKGER